MQSYLNDELKNVQVLFTCHKILQDTIVGLATENFFQRRENVGCRKQVIILSGNKIQ